MVDWYRIGDKITGEERARERREEADRSERRTRALERMAGIRRREEYENEHER